MKMKIYMKWGYMDSGHFPTFDTLYDDDDDLGEENLN